MSIVTQTVSVKGNANNQTEFNALALNFDTRQNQQGVLGWQVVGNPCMSATEDLDGNITVILEQVNVKNSVSPPPSSYLYNRTAAFCGNVKTQADLDAAASSFSTICDTFNNGAYSFTGYNMMQKASKTTGEVLCYFTQTFQKVQNIGE